VKNSKRLQNKITDFLDEIKLAITFTNKEENVNPATSIVLMKAK
jgi:hypothetical protein